ncbi:MAG: hypothetical protein RLZZ337_1192 [Bacteroidota bacterium]|jgi:outer membrane protein OmpA-like peptidoglycan-associated protein
MKNNNLKAIGLYGMLSIVVFFSACKSNSSEEATDEAATTETEVVEEVAPEVEPEVSTNPNDAMLMDIKTWIAEGTGLKTITLDAINWEGEELTAEGRAQLDLIANILEANPNLKAEIQGHTAKKGNAVEDKAAKAASGLRAAWVKAKLMIGHDAAAKNLTTKGYGSERPMEGIDPTDDRQKRITIELSK